MTRASARTTRAMALDKNSPIDHSTRLDDAIDDGATPATGETTALGFDLPPKTSGGGTEESATTAAKGLAVRIGERLVNTVSAFRPFQRATPGTIESARLTRVAVSKPAARHASTANWFVPWDSPMHGRHHDENSKGSMAPPSMTPSIFEDANVLLEANRDLTARSLGSNSKTRAYEPLKIQHGRVHKRQERSKASRYHKRTVPLREGETRRCSKCGLQGDSSHHWRRSYDELSPLFGSDLCDKCGKSESRMLLKRRRGMIA